MVWACVYFPVNQIGYALQRGDNLTELYRALKERKVEWIAEFSPGEHEEPTDTSAPFIRGCESHGT